MLLRAEYALLVGTLDSYLREVASQRMLSMLTDKNIRTKSAENFKIPQSLLYDLLDADDKKSKDEIYNKHLTQALRTQSFLSESGFTEITKLIGIERIWEKVAEKMSEVKSKPVSTSEVRDFFNEAMHRRNQIVHEMDYDVTSKEKRKISKQEVDDLIFFLSIIRSCIENSIIQIKTG